MNWQLKIGNFLFKYRSFTPVPLIIIIIVFFHPIINCKYDMVLVLCGFGLVILGEMIRVLSVGFSYYGTSGRENFLRAENLNITGVYSIVRNPLYIGNMFIYAGLLLVYSNIYALIIFNLILIVQYYFIIKSEENFLYETYGKEYNTYKNNVKSIIPSFGKYKKSENKFNKMKVISKENDSVFNAIIIFGLILMYKEKIVFGDVMNKKMYVFYFALIIISYISIKIFKKRN